MTLISKNKSLADLDNRPDPDELAVDIIDQVFLNVTSGNTTLTSTPSSTCQ